jgi:hypothetical protein
VGDSTLEEGQVLGGSQVGDEDGASASHAFEDTLDVAHRLSEIILIFIFSSKLLDL